jgi:hypothetical protein
VEYLFVSIHDRQWGEFIAKERSITLADDKQSGDEDLLDLAATSTFLNGGKVFAVEREQIPDDNVIASVYRY